MRGNNTVFRNFHRFFRHNCAIGNNEFEWIIIRNTTVFLELKEAIFWWILSFSPRLSLRFQNSASKECFTSKTSTETISFHLLPNKTMTVKEEQQTSTSLYFQKKLKSIEVISIDYLTSNLIFHIQGDCNVPNNACEDAIALGDIFGLRYLSHFLTSSLKSSIQSLVSDF